ncbi:MULTISPECIES: PSD1 and planctomycete cytochrome C domain-containing protein [Pirellulaceae]|uniref:PSD1 and planctomycete cytochrome C domain-containing protein n=1 Tax=Pirellulaceae TaxID=2691357 RepID=UPI001E647759|nr:MULTISPECIES: PSD1 and planctomycete cytochrome C domain-containing protein [Pirellulaceae]
MTALMVLLAVGGTTAHAADLAKPSSQDVAFFESKIRPLLIQHCVDCHGADTQESSLRVDTMSGMLGGGESGAAVIPKDPKHSLLLAAVRYDNEHLKMPPDGKMSDEQIKLLQQWIEMGAPHPDQLGSGSIQPRRAPIDMEEAKRYWAFQPIQPPLVPEAFSQQANPIDSFIAAALDKQGLQPNGPADRRTLIRRATFDLIGLPPTPDEVNAFLADQSPDAFAKVIDRLLASPQYGQRWGRHWLDVVRYADSNGLDENQAFVDAWRYRNYVIDSINADKPFDQFVTEQVAGDLLAKDSTTPSDYDATIATGFLTLGPKVLAEKDVVKMEMDIIDEQIDTLGQAFLGLTIACARCHDHKFDPISTADYYALAGIFKSTQSMQSFKTIAQYNEKVLATDQEKQQKAKLDQAKKEKQDELDKLLKEAKQKHPDSDEAAYPEELRTLLAKLRQEIASIAEQSPELPTAMAVTEGTPENLRIHVRGSHLILGQQVPRGVPLVLQRSEPLSIDDNESGRLQLAQWMVHADNPLTARVAVNRVWRWHFGTGLVPSTDNFGKLGEAPTHPELLDWLAASFVAEGWSLKKLHRQIMLSETYQRSSDTLEANAATDPDNHWYWRANVQRLEAESLRDSLLQVSGKLDTSQGESMLTVDKWKLVFDHTSKDDTSYDTQRRSVYLPVIRNNLYDEFALFDFATADTTQGDRATSTVAPQALFTLNSPLFLDAAENLADRLQQQVPDDDRARIELLYQRTLSRMPEEHEVTRLLTTIDQLEVVLQAQMDQPKAKRQAWTAACQCVLASNEFLYVQ